MSTPQQFEAGNIYRNNYICNSDSYASYLVTRCTEKSVWIVDLDEPKERQVQKRCKIHTYQGDIFFYPDGQYSMAMTIKPRHIAG